MIRSLVAGLGLISVLAALIFGACLVMNSLGGEPGGRLGERCEFRRTTPTDYGLGGVAGLNVVTANVHKSDLAGRPIGQLRNFARDRT